MKYVKAKQQLDNQLCYINIEVLCLTPAIS